MIRISCTNCKTVLSIDDAFAGGVCRCQHCGTIQTVPAKKSGVAGQAVSGPKAIYKGSKSDSGAGLDELAEIVASSGLSGSGLTSRRLTKPPPAPEQKNLVPIFIGVGVVIVLLIVIIVWLAMRGGSNPSPTQANGPTGQTPVAHTSEPNILGVKLDVPSVIYVLDRGITTQEYFAAVKDAALKSAATLGSNRKFQIIFWSNGDSEPAAYPQDSTAYATPDNITAAKSAIEDVYASGASDIKAAFKKALLRNPDAIVIASAKGYALDESWVQWILDMRSSSPSKIDILDLGGDPNSPSAVLKSLADKTGGEYLDVDSNMLRSFVGR